MRNNRKGALPDNRQGSPVLSARQHAAAAQPRPPRTVTYPSAEQAQPPQHLGIHIPHRPDASDHPTDAGHCLTSPPGPNAPTPRRNSPASFKAHPCRRTTVPPSRRLGQSRRHRNPPRAGHCLTSPPGPNAPTPRRNAPAPFKTHPCRRTTAPHRPNPRTTPPAQDSTAPPGTKKSGSASRTYSFVSNFSVKNRRLHLAQTNALTQHNQSGAYPLINPCPHN